MPPDPAASRVTNVVIAGLGGQGVLRASDILGTVLVQLGHDVKKSEVHGMAQRGGSVQSDVRYGPQIFSPMIPPGEADYLVVLAADQVEVHRYLLRPTGILITPDDIPAAALPNRKSLNVALLGRLSVHLAAPESLWLEVLSKAFPPALGEANRQAFAVGRASSPTPTPATP